MHKTLFNFLELSMFIYLKYISNEVDKGLGHGKKEFYIPFKLSWKT